MPFERPTLSDLITRAQADMGARLPGADAALRRSTLGVLARVSAGAAHGLYGYLDWLSRQILPDTSEAEILRRQAMIWGVTPLPANAATGDVVLTGTHGTAIPAGTWLKRADGQRYASLALATVEDGMATVAVVAESPGVLGNAEAGAVLTLASPIAGINSRATVATGGIRQGADAESDDSIRARLLARIRRPPQGGCRDDYVQWALSAPGVTRVWVSTELGRGTVSVRFVRDGDSTIFPDEKAVATVRELIESKRPVTADVYVLAPLPSPVDLKIRLQPATDAVQAAVQAELADLLSREAEPGGTILKSHLDEAISIAAGEHDHRLLYPATDLHFLPGEMATLGDIEWA